MAYKDAFLTNNQRVVFDTGSERIDLTTRVNAGGWQMVTDATPIEYQAITAEAQRRLGVPSDLQISISGGYYGPEILDVRAVKDAKESFAIAFQYDHATDGLDNFKPTGTSNTYFLAGNVVTSNIGIDGSGPIMAMSAVSLQQRSPMVFGTEYKEANFPTAGSSATDFIESSNKIRINFDHLYEYPVLIYDFRGIDFVDRSSETPADDNVLALFLQQPNNEANNGWIRIEVPRNTADSAGMIDLSTIKLTDSNVTAGRDGTGTAPTAIPEPGEDSGTDNNWDLEVVVRYITENSDNVPTGKFGYGYGFKQETD